MVYVIQFCRQLSSSWIRIGLYFHSHPAAARKLSINLYDVHHCWVTVNNSWWWTEELSETCRVSFQNKCEKSVHLVGFIIRKFVTMHGHVNVKLGLKSLWDYKILKKTQNLIFNTIFVNLFEVLGNTFFKERLPEDSYNRWPKHVGGNDVCNKIRPHVIICTSRFCLS
jgi:hypothetical protein